MSYNKTQSQKKQQHNKEYPSFDEESTPRPTANNSIINATTIMSGEATATEGMNGNVRPEQASPPVVQEESQQGTSQEQLSLCCDEVYRQTDAAIKEWKHVVSEVQKEADDMYYYAKELWCEDTQTWNTHKLHTLQGKESIQEFDRTIQQLSTKQKPVWDIIIEKTDNLIKQLEKPYKNLQDCKDKIHEVLNEDPLNRKFMNPLSRLFGKALHEDQQKLKHTYAYKWKAEIQNAHDEYVNLTGFPSGTLVAVKLLRENAVKEAAHITDRVHKKKGIVHDIGTHQPTVEQRENLDDVVVPPPLTTEEKPKAVAE